MHSGSISHRSVPLTAASVLATAATVWRCPPKPVIALHSNHVPWVCKADAMCRLAMTLPCTKQYCTPAEHHASLTPIWTLIGMTVLSKIVVLYSLYRAWLYILRNGRIITSIMVPKKKFEVWSIYRCFVPNVLESSSEFDDLVKVAAYLEVTSNLKKPAALGNR